MVKTYWWIWFITYYFYDIWLKMCVLNKYFWSTCCSLAILLLTSKLYFTIQHMPAKNLCFCSKPPFSVFSMQHAACSERMLQRMFASAWGNLSLTCWVEEEKFIKTVHVSSCHEWCALHLASYIASYIFNLTPQTLHCGGQTIIIVTFTADCKISEKMP